MAVAPGERRSGHSNRVRYELQAQSAAQSAYLSLSRCELVTEFQEASMLANFIRRESDGSFGPESVSRVYPAFYSVTASGQSRRPAAARSSASTVSPVGLRFPLQIFFAKYDEKISPEPPQMQSFGLGSRAPRLASPGVTRAGHGKFNKRRRPTLDLLSIR